jgi:hypothetical protein
MFTVGDGRCLAVSASATLWLTRSAGQVRADADMHGSCRYARLLLRWRVNVCGWRYAVWRSLLQQITLLNRSCFIWVTVCKHPQHDVAESHALRCLLRRDNNFARAVAQGQVQDGAPILQAVAYDLDTLQGAPQTL